MIEAEQLHARILARLDMTRDMEDEELTELIYEVLQEVSQEEYLPLDQKTMLGKELFNAFRKLDLLQEFLEDDDITEIMINGTQNIFIEKAGRISQSDKRFLSADKLEDVIQQIVAGSNRLVNEASPIVDARLADGSRVNVVLPPVALNGPIVTIRKFAKEVITMNKLMEWQSINSEVSGFLASLVAAGYNILVTAVFTAFWTLRSNSARFSACPRKSSNDISLPLSPEPAPAPSSFPSPAPLPSPSPSANNCRLIIGILQRLFLYFMFGPFCPVPFYKSPVPLLQNHSLTTFRSHRLHDPDMLRKFIGHQADADKKGIHQSFCFLR